MHTGHQQKSRPRRNVTLPRTEPSRTVISRAPTSNLLRSKLNMQSNNLSPININSRPFASAKPPPAAMPIAPLDLTSSLKGSKNISAMKARIAKTKEDIKRNEAAKKKEAEEKKRKAQEEKFYEEPDTEPSDRFKKTRAKEKKRITLPPGMTAEMFNSLSPEEASKILGIDMSVINEMNRSDDYDDDYPLKLEEDVDGDIAPPVPFTPDPGKEHASYVASRIPGRRTVNMLPTVKPRELTFKGRATVLRKLPPRYGSKFAPKIRTTLAAMQRLVELTHFDVAVTLVGAQSMRALNLEHRHVNEPTDVLAFPMEDAYGEGIPVELGNIADLGEIVLCVPYIYAQTAIRHATLRSIGINLGDAKMGQSRSVRELQRILSTIADISVDSNGQLIVETRDTVHDTTSYNIDDDNHDNNNNNQEGDTNTHDPKRIAHNVNLPHITLTPQQLDNLPLFDSKEYMAQTNSVLKQAGLDEVTPGMDLEISQAKMLSDGQVLIPREFYSDTVYQQREIERRKAAGIDAPLIPGVPVFMHEVENPPIPGDTSQYIKSDGPTPGAIAAAQLLANSPQPENSKPIPLDSHVVVANTEKLLHGTSSSLHNNNYQHNNNDDPIVEVKFTTGFPPLSTFHHVTESMVLDEMNIVLLHGFLHLCGYDHDTQERRNRMQAETDRLVKLLVDEGIFSQRAAQLAELYVLEDIPDDYVPEERDLLLPAGVLLDDEARKRNVELIKEHKLKKAKLKQQMQKQKEKRDNKHKDLHNMASKYAQAGAGAGSKAASKASSSKTSSKPSKREHDGLSERAMPRGGM